MKQEQGAARLPIVGDGSGLAPGDTFYREELQLAFRNRGMPLEGLQFDITPTGMHYLLTHFDIPKVEVGTWRLHLEGLVSRALTLTLDDIRPRPAVPLAVTMECAGNGRALLSPRPVSQPWLVEAIGTSEWTGTPLRGLLEEAGLKDGVVEVLFTGLDQGVQGDELQYYQRSLTLDEAMRDEVLLAYEMNGRPLEPQHGYPLRLLVPGWYGMTSVKWLDRIEAIGEPFQGYQMTAAYRRAPSAADPGEPVSLIQVRALMVPPGVRPGGSRGGRRPDVGSGPTGRTALALCLAPLVVPLEGDAGPAFAVRSGMGQRRQRPAGRASLELPRDGQQRGPPR